MITPAQRGNPLQPAYPTTAISPGENLRDVGQTLKAHRPERAAGFHRFDFVWTPAVLLLDSEDNERVRLVGYLGTEDFLAAPEARPPPARPPP